MKGRAQNHRPGVYSSIRLEPPDALSRWGQNGAVVAQGPGQEGQVYTLQSRSELGEVFGGQAWDCRARRSVQILLDSGVGRVYYLPVQGDYGAVLARSEQLQQVGAVVCDGQDAQTLTLLKQSVERASSQQRERLGFCGIADGAAAGEIARALNSERVVLCCPTACWGEQGQGDALVLPSALAGGILARDDCTYNWNLSSFPALEIEQQLGEEQVQQLIGAGVTVFERCAGTVECIRAVTTRTHTGEVADRTYHSVNTVLIIDRVMGDLRNALKLRLRGMPISSHGAQSIASQVAVELAAKRDGGMIESFETPRAYQLPEDRSVCVVELAFRVSHVVGQIHLSAHIRV